MGPETLSFNVPALRLGYIRNDFSENISRTGASCFLTQQLKIFLNYNTGARIEQTDGFNAILLSAEIQGAITEKLPHVTESELAIARLHLIENLTTQHVSFGIVHRSEEHTSELQSPCNLVCRLLL